MATYRAEDNDGDGYIAEHCGRWSSGQREQFVRHLGLVLAFYTVPNVFGLNGRLGMPSLTRVARRLT